MNGSSPRLALRVERVRGSEAGLLRVALTITNPGPTPISPGVFASELLVNGESDPSWRLAMNGAMEPELVELPPDRSAELVREVRVRGLRPGRNEIAVRIGEQRSEPVVVDVP
jgi:hypothetical protein